MGVDPGRLRQLPGVPGGVPCADGAGGERRQGPPRLIPVGEQVLQPGRVLPPLQPGRLRGEVPGKPSQVAGANQGGRLVSWSVFTRHQGFYPDKIYSNA